MPKKYIHLKYTTPDPGRASTMRACGLHTCSTAADARAAPPSTLPVSSLLTLASAVLLRPCCTYPPPPPTSPSAPSPPVANPCLPSQPSRRSSPAPSTAAPQSEVSLPSRYAPPLLPSLVTGCTGTWEERGGGGGRRFARRRRRGGGGRERESGGRRIMEEGGRGRKGDRGEILGLGSVRG